MGVAGNDVLQKTADEIAADSELPWDEVHGSSVVVTGSTGLIGSHLVRSLLASNDHRGRDISLILPVRNVEKAQSLFGAREDAKIVPWSLGEEFKCPAPVDYFVHAACGTSSKAFSAAPATTIMQIVAGANEMLKSALEAECKKFVFLSTMEVYGEVEGVACEDNLGKLDPMVVRNSYPEAKRLAECLCASFCSQFDLPTVVLRLAQTFGQGVNKDDARVFAEFGRSAVSGGDIVLFSDGSKRNAYLSVNDAVRAVLVALKRGCAGEAYNVANEDTYCSIFEMAEFVLKNYGAEGAVVRREVNKEREATFRKSSNLILDSTKLRNLGWRPHDGLNKMYESMFSGWDAV